MFNINQLRKVQGKFPVCIVISVVLAACLAGCPLPEPTPEPEPAAEPTVELTAPSAMAAPELAARNNSLAVTWNPPTNNGGSDITAYNLRHRAEGSPAENAEKAEWTELSYGIIGAGYTIGELTNGIVYEVQMRAVNAQGTGPWSESAALAPAHVPGAPAPPVLEAKNTALTVTWNAPPDIGGSDITAYDLRYRESRDAGNAEWTEIEWAKIIEGITPAPSITDTHYTIGSGLANGLMYEVQARAINGEGTGPWSESAVLAPATVPSAPVVTLEANDRELVATWTVTDDGGNAISAYNLRYRETVGEGEEPVEWTDLSYGIIGARYTFSRLTNGAEYEASIQAINAQGTGGWSAAVAGTPWYFPLQEEITASDAAANDNFGSSAAIHGNTAIVGAPFDNTTATDEDNMEITLADSGSAYIFTKGSTGNWSQQAKLVATNAVSGAEFGNSVAIYENTAIIGAQYDTVITSTGDSMNPTITTTLNAGAAYIFIRDSSTGNWSQQAKLVATNAAPANRFGRSVAIYENTVIVGAPFVNNGGNSNSGSAYIFTRNSTGTWSQTAELLSTGANYNFGTSVAIYGNTIIVGIPGADSSKGAVREYRRNGTTWSAIYGVISAQDRIEGNEFGSSVAFDGTTIIVGAQGNFDNGPTTGAAYIFTKMTEWRQQTKLTATDAATGDQFGASVAISGNTAIVGAHKNNAAGESSGSAYVFTRGSDGLWRRHDKMLAPDAAAGDTFGTSVAFNGETAIVGAPLTDDVGSKSGSAYLFSQREQ